MVIYAQILAKVKKNKFINIFKNLYFTPRKRFPPGPSIINRYRETGRYQEFGNVRPCKTRFARLPDKFNKFARFGQDLAP